MEFLKGKISSMIEQINKQKEDVLKDKLESAGIVLDLESEKTSRFKSLVCETQGNKETWYYNNGTPGGERVVTFEKVEKNTFPDVDYTIGIEFKYY